MESDEGVEGSRHICCVDESLCPPPASPSLPAVVNVTILHTWWE